MAIIWFKPLISNKKGKEGKDMDAQQEKQNDTQGIICKSCGAKMKFDPKKGCLHCDYCGADEKVEAEQGEIKKYDINTAAELLSHDWGTKTVSIKCRNCGAQTVLEADKTADFCVFCGSPMIERVDSQAELAPGYVIPFKVSMEDAAKSFKKWLKGLFFRPRKLKSSAQMQKLKGVYIPHYAFDCDTVSQYTATAEQDKDHRSEASGSIARNHKNVVVPASTHVNKKLEGNFGFMLGSLLKYKPEFISGFSSERVSIPVNDGWGNGRAEVDRIIRSSIETQVKQQYRVSTVYNISVRTQYSNIKCAVVLLPIWLSVYTFGKKRYEFMINGQSGAVKGKSPRSAAKILIYLAVTGLLFYLIQLLSLTVAVILAVIMLIVLLSLVFS
jgi:ribosomal protein L37E